MENNFTNFLEAYKTAPDSIKALIDSEDIGLFIDTLNAPSAKLQKRELVDLISNTILGMFTQAEFNMKLNNALALDEEIIKKISDFTFQKTAYFGVDSSETPPSESSSTPPATPSLHTVRTMSSDGAAMSVPLPEATYSSVQSAILNESKRT